MSKRFHARRSVRYVALVGAAASAAAMSPGIAMGAESDGPGLDVVTVVDDLNGPRGIAVDAPNRILYSEADGTISQSIRRGQDAGTDVLGSVPPNFIAPAISQVFGKRIDILTAQGDPGSGAASLYRWSPRSGEAKFVVDIAAYQATDPDPYDLEDLPDESNPYGLEALEDGSTLVADAAGNDLLRVSKNGDIETVARIKPRTVLVPEELAGVPDLPPPGSPIPAESVVTSVTVGSDGYYYVGELRGFPATPGTSEVWRIAPDAVDAVCDPENPNSGDCTRFADGYTSIVDLAPGPDGSIYVIELVKESWLQWELGLVDPPIGGIFRAEADGRSVELADNQLILPGGIDTSRSGKIFVASPIFDEGAIVRVRDGLD